MGMNMKARMTRVGETFVAAQWIFALLPFGNKASAARLSPAQVNLVASAALQI